MSEYQKGICRVCGIQLEKHKHICEHKCKPPSGKLKCSKCGEEKPYSQFRDYRDRIYKNGNKGGLSTLCAECKREDQRKAFHKYNKKVEKEQKPCVICKKMYTPRSDRQKTCGADHCKRELQRRREFEGQEVDTGIIGYTEDGLPLYQKSSLLQEYLDNNKEAEDLRMMRK